ncbi:hypothetical protein DL764_010433 [Monosporascus ibericus]|uniref:Uncharacterized protein n=1 Tax=Monosporascus ibericus TaxID=155417 RepID=A0A4Q4SRI4_9PEZI|nr:hypothetical protein DL764_010433 [Monosporascus ibericus]
MEPSVKIKDILSQVIRSKPLASEVDDDAHRKLMLALHKLAHSIEDTNDTVHRFGYLHLQTAAIRTGFGLGLFKLVSETEASTTQEHIA